MTLYHDADCVSAIELGVATPNVIPLASIGQFSNALFNFYFACWFILLHTSLSSNACHSEKLTIVNNLLMVAPSWKRVKPDIALLAAAKIVFLPDSNRAVPQKPVTIFIISRQTYVLFCTNMFIRFGGA